MAALLLRRLADSEGKALFAIRDCNTKLAPDASAENIKKLISAGEKTLNHWRLKGLDGFLDGMVE